MEGRVTGRPPPMRLTSPTEVRALLDRMDFRASRVMGQNFLIDGNILRIMLDAAELQPDDPVLEIGPGLGVLTGPLLERARHVTAIEKDDVLHGHLLASLAGNDRLELIHGDALEVLAARPELVTADTKVVANLPYSVGTRLLVELFHAAARPVCLVVTVQWEVAQRIVARADTDDYGLLSVFAQLDYEATVVKRIARTCFFPRPDVASAVVKLMRRAQRAVPLRDDAVFRRVARDCFAHRRKQLGSLVRDEDALRCAGLDPRQRPETVDVPGWCRLANALAPAPDPGRQKVL